MNHLTVIWSNVRRPSVARILHIAHRNHSNNDDDSIRIHPRTPVVVKISGALTVDQPFLHGEDPSNCIASKVARIRGACGCSSIGRCFRSRFSGKMNVQMSRRINHLHVRSMSGGDNDLPFVIRLVLPPRMPSGIILLESTRRVECRW